MTRQQTLSDAQILSSARSVVVEHGDRARIRQISKAVGSTWGIDHARMGCHVPADPKNLLNFVFILRLPLFL
jgi:hypothetical protein